MKRLVTLLLALTMTLSLAACGGGTPADQAGTPVNSKAIPAKYYSLTEQFIIPDPVFVSKVWFDRLSAEDQAALIAAGEQFTKEWNEDIFIKTTADALDELRGMGVQVTEVDKDVFVQATQPVVDDFLAKADADQQALYELLMNVRANY